MGLSERLNEALNIPKSSKSPDPYIQPEPSRVLIEINKPLRILKNSPEFYAKLISEELAPGDTGIEPYSDEEDYLPPDEDNLEIPQVSPYGQVPPSSEDEMPLQDRPSEEAPTRAPAQVMQPDPAPPEAAPEQTPQQPAAESTTALATPLEQLAGILGPPQEDASGNKTFKKWNEIGAALGISDALANNPDKNIAAIPEEWAQLGMTLDSLREMIDMVGKKAQQAASRAESPISSPNEVQAPREAGSLPEVPDLTL